MMMKQKTSLGERLNIGDEVRELKLGCTFNSKNTTNAFHTIKYDFKPASVDKNRVAVVDVGSNNQVTVTVPNLVSSGVPHTIYKGNQKKYAKECILIYDKRTGDITLEKLNHNIQVKKTREMTNKPSVPIPSSMPAVGAIASTAATTGPAPKLENSTMRITSKTKVSTGNRKNTIIELKSRNSPMQGSPSAGIHANRSPQSAPAWNANNGQATLPSIPMIVDDDDSIFSIGGGGSGGGAGAGGGGGIGGGGGFNNLANVSASSSSSTSSHNNSTQEFDFQQLLQNALSPTKQSKQSHHSNQKRHNNHQRHQQQQQQQQHQQHLQHQPPPQQQQQLHQQQQQTHNAYNRYNGNGNSSTSSSLFSNNHSNNLQNSNHNNTNNNNNYHNNYDLASSPTLASEAAALEQNIASDLSSSSSSSESESSGSDSGSDSDDSTEDDRPTRAAAAQMMNQLPSLAPMTTLSSPQMHYGQTQNNHNHLNSNNNSNHNNNSNSNNNINSRGNHNHIETNNQNSIGNFGFNDGFPNDLLQNDLQLSSNSSDDDSD
ncbi:ell-associated factor Eaf [Stomoxys calcitrans]|uniref:ell-associated factor Eaf n=1 Tax=Stomoxys calcitrans TaxID=35570 RepID=UPI0027E2F1C2|nr:ell-associated factor Eaf [Stomoxys calcitrans]XP_013109052.2 ell-associated factor Eaf [Stomoxys calcitrans]XP_013109053.2 ell-associated factor Eaf [Stomoxys calcitrans]XP_013109054.2 ell-associated factor Eaf [Stomoxys calcitrans]